MYKNISHRTRKFLTTLMIFILFLIPSKVINATSLEDVYEWSRDKFMSYNKTLGEYSTTGYYATTTGRMLCINDKQGTRGWTGMKLYNILDINADQSGSTLTTASSRGTNAGTKSHKQAAKLAYVSWYGTYMDGKNSLRLLNGTNLFLAWGMGICF